MSHKKKEEKVIMNNNLLKEFLATLYNEMTDLGVDYTIASLAGRFAIWVGSAIFELRLDELSDWLLFYDDVNRAIIGYFDKSDGKAHVVICWYEASAIDSTIDEVQLQELLKFGSLTSNSDWNNQTDNEFLLQLNEDEFIEVQYTLVTNSNLALTHHQATTLLGLIRLRDSYMRMKNPQRVIEPSELKLSIAKEHNFIGPSVTNVAQADEDIPTLVCALPMKLIYEWVNEYENGLFDANLRYRLVNESGKNARELESEIRKTILEKPGQMFVQNNGITITCKEIKTESANSGSDEISLVRLLNPQIVNGCQTSWAIHQVFHDLAFSESVFPEGHVLAKIIATNDRILATSVTNASNRQNTIEPRDRKAHDSHQMEISTSLARLTENHGIFWDYRRGAWAIVEANDEQWRYKVKGHRTLTRRLNNELAGQIILAMVGAIDEAKNKSGQLFTNDKLYKVAYEYELPASERFKELTLAPPLTKSGSLTTYIEDMLFGFAIHQLAESAFKQLYSERDKLLKKELEIEDSQERKEKLKEGLNLITSREFVKYWRLDVVRLIHLIVEQWVKNGQTRDVIRTSLVGDLNLKSKLDPLFLPLKKRSEYFKLEFDFGFENTLDRNNPSDDYKLLGKWFVSLEMLGAEVIEPIKENEPNIPVRTLLLSRARETHGRFVKKLEDSIFSTAKLSAYFPTQ